MTKFYKENLNTFLLGFMLIGIIIGYFLPNFASIISPLGLLFLNALKLLIIPVVFFAMLIGIINLKDSSNLGTIGLKAIALLYCYYSSCCSAWYNLSKYN